VTVSDKTPDPTSEAESPLQQYGYIRCYRAVVQSCGITAAYLYGIIEDYVQLGARTHKVHPIA
jgi:hypothetical protein